MRDYYDVVRTQMTFVLKLKHELKEYAVLSAYLYLCFAALVLYKAAILSGVGIGYAPLGVAAVKALVLAKFVLLGHAIRLGDRLGIRRIVYTIAAKASLYLVLLIVLSIVEEVVVGIVHERTIAASFAELGGGTLSQMLITSFIVFLILVPYLTSREIDVALGEGRLWDILFEQRGALRSDRTGERPTVPHS
jgi:hypothetical protein